MAKVKLTAGRVSSFKCEEDTTQAFLWCDSVPGLAVRATANGTKSYIFQGRFQGKTMRVTIGSVQAWGIDAARAEARRLQVLIDSGDDPRQVKAEKQAATEAKQLADKCAEAIALDVWEIYIQARTPRWSARSLIDHQRLATVGGKPKTRGRRQGEGTTTIQGILRPLLLLPLAKIDADRVRAWLKVEAAHRPTQANNAFVRLRAFLNWCADSKEYRSFTQTDACAARVARDELPKKKAKQDCLQREQLKIWFEKVKSIPNHAISANLQISLLTGARREEVANIRWADVDFQWKSIRIADKVEGERTIPLTPYVATLLADLKCRNETPPARFRILNGKKIENDLANWKPSEWVFASRKAKSGRLQDPSIQHRAACASAGINGLTIHGLRRSFGTLAEWVECPAGVVAQIQGHKPSATAEKHYRVRPLDLLRLWHCKIEAWLLEQAGIKVVPEAAVLRAAS